MKAYRTKSVNNDQKTFELGFEAAHMHRAWIVASDLLEEPCVIYRHLGKFAVRLKIQCKSQTKKDLAKAETLKRKLTDQLKVPAIPAGRGVTKKGINGSM